MNLTKKCPQVFELFQIYHQFEEKEVVEMFKKFPYLYCVELVKLRQFLGEFRKYRMDKRLITKLITQSGGLLATKPGSFRAYYAFCKDQFDMKATEASKILDFFPEMSI